MMFLSFMFYGLLYYSDKDTKRFSKHGKNGGKKTVVSGKDGLCLSEMVSFSIGEDLWQGGGDSADGSGIFSRRAGGMATD